ncbi:Ecm8p NDAI_0A07530 [Naumovozyma dairenensis CBS 421]|uniref:Uncharacterized protein n=1 Tax=Naumovozyma dairenensis (strain ATCC 10597 / BCRC 20456 / CBS 421 / NBRC 0211 / NRRL Y-12639) TaxID=1071378 RepID=G0W519_NAUDC|nr:hypothetical protein NDAI_0A07530 [Naumovozyma dairenensis CBS 421]CCD22907.1 hypothetical protein NDAI_0A07530 [Naumovozyma dairenensis CBS 421]
MNGSLDFANHGDCFASNIDFWIDTNSTELREESKSTLSLFSLNKSFLDITNISNGAETLRRKTPKKALKKKEENNSQLIQREDSRYIQLRKVDTTCKDSTICSKNCLVYLPRTFQHHKIHKLVKQRQFELGYSLRKNIQCPLSACSNVKESSALANNKYESALNWVSYKYIRSKEGKKDVMCRFCLGSNWIEGVHFFRHLFLAHGIITEINQEGKAKLPYKLINKEINQNTTLYIEQLNIPKFSRTLLPFLSVSFIPMPFKYYSRRLNGGFRRTHVLCPSCSNWVHLGWFEHDEIIKEGYQNFDSIRNFNIDYQNISYIQERDRRLIEGLYENYFIHYIHCGLSRLSSKCMFVEISTTEDES